MERVQLFAHPWWVNLLLVVPLAGFWWWHRSGLRIAPSQLGLLTLWGSAFGFVEATVVVYLRGVVGAQLGYEPTFSGIAAFSVHVARMPMIELPRDLLLLEAWREVATIVMLLAVAMLLSKNWKERPVYFLWAFAVWDICYYLGLYVTIQWPGSPTTLDILFLIPEPWIAQVWFPILVSGLTLLAIGWSAAGTRSRAAGY